jgi:NADH pyrophosphatase NudC (nudix superfamily)
MPNGLGKKVKTMSGDFRCVDCGSEFRTREELNAHRQFPCDKTPQYTINKKMELTKDSEWPTKCDKCDKICLSWKGYRRHSVSFHNAPRTAKAIAKQKRKEKIKQLSEQNTTKVMEVTKEMKVEDIVKIEQPKDIIKENIKERMLLCNTCKIMYITIEDITHCPKCGKPLFDIAKEVKVIKLEYK